MEWQEGGKELSGWLPSRCMASPPGSPLPSRILKGSLKEEKAASSTGKSSSTLSEKGLFDPFASSLDPITMSSQDQRLQKSTFGRKLLESMERNLNLGSDRSSVMSQPIGSKFGSPQSPEILAAFPRTSAYVLILHCGQSARSLWFQLGRNEWLLSTGAEAVLESRAVLGGKPVIKLILKIPEASSGVAIRVKKMLFLMNFEEALISPTYLDGWIDTQSGWKSKDLVCPCVLGGSGSRRMFTQLYGGQTWTLQH